MIKLDMDSTSFYADLPLLTEFSDAGRQERCAALTAWLDQRFARRELVYGAHVANRAQMTCLVFDHSGRHLHFIDGADGGLSMAAKALKQRVAKLN